SACIILVGRVCTSITSFITSFSGLVTSLPYPFRSQMAKVELRIPAEKFPLPPRVEDMLRLYAGLGKWEGNVAVFELPMYRLEELEQAMRAERKD
ncbi:MAG: hypothetical protein LC775_15330, partial [Acidobacteria bacterium]|nr:hypothetical protein [Acidobacteriota bacterium]